MSFTFTLSARAQNLVPNGSFEERSDCIWNDSNIEFAPPWYNVQPYASLVPASPDIFHECAISNTEPCPYPDNAFLDPWLFGIPTNFLGCEDAQAGDGYAGIFCFSANPDQVDGYREYLSVPLVEALEANEIYDVKFWVSSAERATHAIWNIQVLFTEDSVSQELQAEPITNLTPQLNGTPGNFINNREGWQELSWQYTAEGGERFMTIGNFQLNSQTDTIRIMFDDTEDHYFQRAYYYIDNVSVMKQVLSIDAISSGNFVVFPNPCENFIQGYSEEELHSFSLYTLDGKLLRKEILNKREFQINVSMIPAGMYVIQLESRRGHLFTKKIVKR